MDTTYSAKSATEHLALPSSAPGEALFEASLAAKVARSRAELLDEYTQHHTHPWVIGFSGGKDSTLVVQLVLEMLLELPRSDRQRAVHIVANDTLVESPLVVRHLRRTMDRLDEAARAFRLPVEVRMTTPDPDHTFWVNLIGRGYPTPSRSFRWCTDRMKILPTSRYIRAQAAITGSVVLLLGVRRAESAARAARVDRYTENGARLNRHNDLADCLVFRPVVDWETDEVWEFLASVHPAWGGTHRELIDLYRHAQGGECPVVTQKSDAPSCGSSSSRFGCWTCTVVVKDRSLKGFVEAGFAEFGPLLAFRGWLVTLREQPGNRTLRRRNGDVTHMGDGSLVHGPFTLAVRREILERLLAIEEQTVHRLISTDEVDRIKHIWAEDAVGYADSKRFRALAAKHNPLLIQNC
jgi:DNA sulfur modification protein DndC